MVTAPVSATLSTRRALLRWTGALLAGGSALLTGCGTRSSQSRISKVSSADGGTDAALLNRLLDLEHRAIGAYTAGIPLLSGHILTGARLFLSQELSHAGELSGLVKQAGGKASLPHESYDFGHPHSAPGVLALLHTVESAQLAAYVELIPRLSSGRIRATATSILANDAQHVSVLRAALRVAPVPSAFVTGRE